jgi:hypothetical protein
VEKEGWGGEKERKKRERENTNARNADIKKNINKL